MTLGDLLKKVNTEKPNSFSYGYLTDRTNDVEAMVYDFLETAAEDRTYYSWPDDKDTELVVQPPYDDVYESYIKAKIDYANEEYESYSNNQVQFNEDMSSWRAYAMRKGLVDTSEIPVQIKNWW